MVKFLALISSVNSEDSFTIENEHIILKAGPVYENGYEFSEEILVKGEVEDETKLKIFLVKYLKKPYGPKIRIKKIQLKKQENKKLKIAV